MNFDPAPFEAAMWQQVDAVDEAATRAREAEAALAAARESAARAMHDYGTARVLAELPHVDHDAVRELYWRRPNLHVAPIADAFGIRSASMVHQVAGPGSVTAPCFHGCGR